MSWCPDDVKVRTKFIHAASVEGMKKAITGISAFVQVSVHPVEICDPISTLCSTTNPFPLHHH
jgi:hypothetical protein